MISQLSTNKRKASQDLQPSSPVKRPPIVSSTRKDMSLPSVIVPFENIDKEMFRDGDDIHILATEKYSFVRGEEKSDGDDISCKQPIDVSDLIVTDDLITFDNWMSVDNLTPSHLEKSSVIDKEMFYDGDDINISEYEICIPYLNESVAEGQTSHSTNLLFVNPQDTKLLEDFKDNSIFQMLIKGDLKPCNLELRIQKRKGANLFLTQNFDTQGNWAKKAGMGLNTLSKLKMGASLTQVMKYKLMLADWLQASGELELSICDTHYDELQNIVKDNRNQVIKDFSEKYLENMRNALFDNFINDSFHNISQKSWYQGGSSFVPKQSINKVYQILSDNCLPQPCRFEYNPIEQFFCSNNFTSSSQWSEKAFHNKATISSLSAKKQKRLCDLLLGGAIRLMLADWLKHEENSQGTQSERTITQDDARKFIKIIKNPENIDLRKEVHDYLSAFKIAMDNKEMRCNLNVEDLFDSTKEISFNITKMVTSPKDDKGCA